MDAEPAVEPTVSPNAVDVGAVERNPFPKNDPRHEPCVTFLESSRGGLELLTMNGVPDTRRILARFDRLADEALKKFFQGLDDLDSWKQIVQCLAKSVLAAMGKNVTEIVRSQLTDQQRLWEEIAKRVAENANVPERCWNVSCSDQIALETRRERFERLAEHATLVELGINFKHRSQAVDAWLDLLQRESPYADRRRVRPLCLASAECCAERRTRTLKKGQSMQADIWGDLAQRFGDLAGPAAAKDPNADLYAYRRVDSEAAELERSEVGSSRPIPDSTPVCSREERLQQFISAHPGTTLADVRHSADLHKPEFQDWRTGKLGDTSVVSQRIENVLAGRRLLQKNPWQRRPD